MSDFIYGFKAVYRRPSDGRLCSIVGANELRVIYKPGHLISPPECALSLGYGLAVFQALQPAESFISNYPDLRLYVASWRKEMEMPLPYRAFGRSVPWRDKGRIYDFVAVNYENIRAASKWRGGEGDWPESTLFVRELILHREILIPGHNIPEGEQS